MGFEKLIDFLFEFLADILPFHVVKVFEKCVVLRFGKIYSIREAGIHLKIPFADNPICIVCVTTTIETPVQTLLTKDLKAVSVKSVIKYSVPDVRLYTETIYDATDAIEDIAQGLIMTAVNGANYSECYDTTTLSNTLTKRLRNEVKKNGIYIEQQTITNFIETRNYRLFKDGQ